MSLQYGIELAEETISRLSADESLTERLLHGWSEIDVMEEGDTSEEWFKTVKDWKEKYLSGSTNPNSDEYNQELITDLLFICGGIVNENKRLIPDEE